MNDTLRLGRAALVWAGSFYRHHFLLVFGLSIIPTVQRFWVVSSEPPLPISIATEVLVAGARILLLVLIVKIMLAEVGAGGRTAWARLEGAISARRTAFLGQWVLLAIAFLIFDVLVGVLISATVPESSQGMVNAVVVAVKNPTVIAFTMLWMAGVVRTLIVGRGISEPAGGAATDQLPPVAERATGSS